MAKEKTHMNLVFIGHVDHGKSTSVGRLLYDSKNIDEQTMRKLTEKAKELGKPGFEFAFVMDNLKEEQERGLTIDLAHKRFDTDKFYGLTLASYSLAFSTRHEYNFVAYLHYASFNSTYWNNSNSRY